MARQQGIRQHSFILLILKKGEQRMWQESE
nr:MAG TPA: hypothetical protein [Caudoviricetes sp.]DAR72086.1 MAG TPA: hypothetical protein [Caudoviricetes sp.]